VLDPVAEVYEALVLGTRDYVQKNHFTDVVIGLSGGIDSTIVACIAVDALGADHVHGVSMPSRYSSEGSKDDAKALAENLGIDYRTIAIEPAFTAYLEMYAPSFADRLADLTEENLQSRIRGTTLMGLSNKFGWMVLTTGNKSEMAVGYFTIYGDSVGGYGVIKDVLKTSVYDLCRHYNAREGREIIPEAVITKPPSAELRRTSATINRCRRTRCSIRSWRCTSRTTALPPRSSRPASTKRWYAASHAWWTSTSTSGANAHPVCE